MFGLRARANVRALNIAGQHARAVGALMDIAVQTMDKMQRAQDRAREFAAREAHHAELFANHSEQFSMSSPKPTTAARSRPSAGSARRLRPKRTF